MDALPLQRVRKKRPPVSRMWGRLVKVFSNSSLFSWIFILPPTCGNMNTTCVLIKIFTKLEHERYLWFSLRVRVFHTKCQAFSPVVRIGSSRPPSPEGEFPPPPPFGFFWGGDTLACRRRGGGSQFGQGDRHCGTVL